MFEKRFTIAASDVRVESHRLADQLIGALTGQNGGFASHMTFATGSGKQRRVYSIDADGNNARPISSPPLMCAMATTKPRSSRLMALDEKVGS